MDDVKQLGHPRLPGDVHREVGELGQQPRVVLALDDVEELEAAAPDRPALRAGGADGRDELRGTSRWARSYSASVPGLRRVCRATRSIVIGPISVRGERRAQLADRVDDPLRARRLELLAAADAPGDADRGQPVRARGHDVVEAVADNHGAVPVADGGERPAEAGRLLLAGVRQLRAVDEAERREQAEPVEQRDRQHPRLRGHDRHRAPCRELAHERADLRHELGLGDRALAVARAVCGQAVGGERRVGALLGEQRRERVDDRRADEVLEIALGPLLEPARLERRVHRARDGDARVHEHAVEVEEHGSAGRRHVPEGRRRPARFRRRRAPPRGRSVSPCGPIGRTASDDRPDPAGRSQAPLRHARWGSCPTSISQEGEWSDEGTSVSHGPDRLDARPDRRGARRPQEVVKRDAGS